MSLCVWQLMGTLPHSQWEQGWGTPGGVLPEPWLLGMIWTAILSDDKPPSCQENDGNKASGDAALM